MSSEIRRRGDGKSNAEASGEAYLSALNDMAPTPVKKYIDVATPYIAQCIRIIEQMIPYLLALYTSFQQYAILLQPYKIDLLIPGFCGLVMCFFGGNFMTIIAAVEAYRMIGFQSQLKFIRDLKTDFEIFLEANRADDEEDVDGDGVADVRQINKKALVQRKTLLFLKSIEPVRVSSALEGLQSGFLAVIATLKMQFCKAITLGSAIAEIVMKPADKYILPPLEGALPDEYKKWSRPAISWTVKCGAISFAWFVQRIISAFHSAMRGGHMFAENMIDYLNHMGYYTVDPKNSQVDEMIGYIVTALGLWFQLRSGFSLPFPLNVLLLPFTMLEWWLMWILNIK